MFMVYGLLFVLSYYAHELTAGSLSLSGKRPTPQTVSLCKHILFKLQCRGRHQQHPLKVFHINSKRSVFGLLKKWYFKWYLVLKT